MLSDRQLISWKTDLAKRIHKLHILFKINFNIEKEKVGWLCWGLTSQSTIFQSCRDGAIASWVINQYFRGVKCLAQGHNTAAVGLEPRTSRSGVRHSTTEPPRSPWKKKKKKEKELKLCTLLYKDLFICIVKWNFDNVKKICFYRLILWTRRNEYTNCIFCLKSTSKSKQRKWNFVHSCIKIY